MFRRGDTEQIYKRFACLPEGFLLPLLLVAKQTGRVRGKTVPYQIFWVYIHMNVNHK